MRIEGGSTATTVNGLNQITFSGGSFLHDARGNLTFDAANRSYGYSSENLLVSSSASGTPSVSLGYDSLSRLNTVSATATARFAYDGLDMIAEYDGSNNLVRRYVHGPGTDELLVEYNSSDWRYHHLDERGSVVAWSDPAGVLATVNRYDEYGRPQAGNIGRFQFTGQLWLPEVGLYHYKARAYAPNLGRFLQTDPIGYAGGVNLYAYTLDDPINLTDPQGTQCTGTRISSGCGAGGIGTGFSGFSTAGPGGRYETGWQIIGTRFDLTGLSDFEIRSLAMGYWQLLEQANDALGGSAQLLQGRCAGQFQCETTPTQDMGLKVIGLLNNQTFLTMMKEAWVLSLRERREYAFGGRGYANFAATTELLPGSRDSISRRLLLGIVATGATVYFHTHPNIHMLQGPSDYDIARYQEFGLFGVVRSQNTLYFFDWTMFRSR